MSKFIPPKVSIIIPVYNGAKYVRFAIESALAQTYSNLEILVIDDGSTDNTEMIVKSYGDKVRYIKKKNGGVSSALNLGIKEMKGEYFSWLSHDDTYEPNKVEREIEFLKENELLNKKVIVFSDYYLIDKKGKLIGESKKDHDEIVLKPEYIFLKGHINGLSLLIPKQAFNDFGTFDTSLVCTQDYDMWLRMSKKYSFVHIPESLVSTRWHSKQVTNTNPKVVTEGNDFYLNIIKSIPRKRMEELEGSEYSFMRELADFYSLTEYDEVKKYCLNRADELLGAAKGKSEEKKVSIVIPFYNRSEVLGRAIESVLKQKHKNFEIILIDDASNDDVSRVTEFVKKHDNIKLIRNKKNLGASASRNIGIYEATGDYVAFLDSDDEFLPEKLEIQLQYMIASKTKFSHTSYIREMEGKEKIIPSGMLRGHCGLKMMYSCGIATPTVMLERKWFVENGFKFDEKIEIGEDTCLWLTLMKKNVYLVGIEKPLSVVHVGERAAAYDLKKQILGFKSIITFLLNDEYYSKYDLELSRLMEPYVEYVRKVRHLPEVFAKGNSIQKFVFFTKYEGIGSAIKRTVKKFKKRQEKFGD